MMVTEGCKQVGVAFQHGKHSVETIRRQPKITSPRKIKLLNEYPGGSGSQKGIGSDIGHCGCVDSLKFVGIKHNGY